MSAPRRRPPPAGGLGRAWARRDAPALRIVRASSPALAAVLLAATAAVAWASGGDEGASRGPRVAPTPAYRAECAACHVAYAPHLLPAQSWRRLMATLPKHFGSDASLDAATTKALGDWLQANAADAASPGRGRRAGAPPDDRITRSPWFVHAHHEVGADVFRRASVRSPSHCAACHAGAERGVFDEHDVRIPR